MRFSARAHSRPLLAGAFGFIITTIVVVTLLRNTSADLPSEDPVSVLPETDAHPAPIIEIATYPTSSTQSEALHGRESAPPDSPQDSPVSDGGNEHVGARSAFERKYGGLDRQGITEAIHELMQSLGDAQHAEAAKQFALGAGEPLSEVLRREIQEAGLLSSLSVGPDGQQRVFIFQPFAYPDMYAIQLELEWLSERRKQMALGR